jgi:hypothetical protein
MRALTSDEITVVSGGSLQTIDVIASRLGWKPLSTKQAEALIEQHAAAAAATIPIMVAFVVGLATNYAYESMGGKEGIDKALEDFEKWCDEKAKEIAATGTMAYEDAKCALKTLGAAGIGDGPLPCSMTVPTTGASGSW